MTWMLPRWLDRRLPHFRIEGHGERPGPADEGHEAQDRPAEAHRETAEVSG